MVVKKGRRELVKYLLEKDITAEDEAELLDLLSEETIAKDLSLDDLYKDKFSDKLINFFGSWLFIILFLLVVLVFIFIYLAGIIKLKEFPYLITILVLVVMVIVESSLIMINQKKRIEQEKIRLRQEYRNNLKTELINEDSHYKLEEILRYEKRILRLLEDDVNDKKDK